MSVYLSLAEAPLDVYDPVTDPDIGDGDPHQGLMTPFEGLVHPPAAAAQAAFVIPYSHPIELGTVGRFVVGAKRAVWAANGLPVPARATQTFGPTAVKQLRLFQRKHGLPADGVLGPTTLRKLGPFFDAYAFLLYVGYPPGASPRTRIVAYATWAYNHRDEIGYAQYRPMAYMGELEHLPINEDCSTFATKAYKYGGGPDPNGLHFDGYGNTGTMRMHGSWVSLADSRPGDLAHYDGPQHVGVVVVGGSGGRVIEHGSAIAPLLLPTTYRPVAEVRSYI